MYELTDFIRKLPLQQSQAHGPMRLPKDYYQMQQALLHWQRTLLKEEKLVLEYGGKLTKLLHQLQDAESQKKQNQRELEPLLAEPDYTVEDDSEWQKAARANEDKIGR